MPVLGDAGVVSSILNCILKLTSATPNADICSRCVLRAAELDPRGHKRAVDAHRLLCLAVAMRVRAAGRLRKKKEKEKREARENKQKEASKKKQSGGGGGNGVNTVTQPRADTWSPEQRTANIKAMRQCIFHRRRH
jgi:hypothetical protein